MASGGLLRDFVLIALGVGLVFGALFAYSGVWPPVVVVETGSMMHVDAKEMRDGTGTTRADGTGFGRIGTMDPGDLVLIKEVGSIDEITTYAQASQSSPPSPTSYGMPGEVVAYRLSTDEGSRTVVHRAMTYVQVQGEGDQTTYRVTWSPSWQERGDCVQRPVYTCIFGADGVTLPELGLRQTTFGQSGLITKGDNAFTNRGADQVGSPPIADGPILLSSVVGTVRGEVPAVGLLKLAFSGQTLLNAEVQAHPYFVRIGNVVAPLDSWTVLIGEMIAASLSPLVVSMARDFTRQPSRKVSPELSVLERAWEDTAAARSAHRQERARQPPR